MKSIVLVEDVLPGDVIEGRTVIAVEPSMNQRDSSTIELTTTIYFGERGGVSQEWHRRNWTFARKAKIMVERDAES